MGVPSKSTVVWILLAAVALTAVFLPSSCTGWLRRPFQPLALLQWPVASSARETERVAHNSLGERITAAEAQRLRTENAELERLVVQQQLALNDFEERWERVTGLRDVLPDNDVQLVLAPVVAYDADPRRATLQIALNERTAPLVKPGQWVAAGLLQTPSRELLERQWLIGRVSEVQTRLARVQLATDPKFRTEVRVAILTDGTRWALSDEGCVLDGRGGGRMLISQARADYYEEGYRMVVVPASRELPFPLTLGQIESSKRRSDSSQHWDLAVVPWGPAESLTHVFVISRER